jgi:hypothetical protein
MADQDNEIANSVPIKAAFGAENRARLINMYFKDVDTVSATNAWKHIYKLLLWIDRTTGLAHCYESDKCQPGKHWYPRSLAFHDWVSNEIGVTNVNLSDSLDWLFNKATLDLSQYILHSQERVVEKAKQQMHPFADKTFPVPGEDPELIHIVNDVLSPFFSGSPPDDAWRQLVQRVRQHVALENKRKNLVGEGFEDVLAITLGKVLSPSRWTISPRIALQEIPGFINEQKGEKVNKVDVVAISGAAAKRILITVKWSIRADREKQFPAEFASYVKAKSDKNPFDYVLVTNEFDPARLLRACEMTAANHFMFTDVVHICPEGLRAAYGKDCDNSMKAVVDLIDAKRLIGLDKWITKMNE